METFQVRSMSDVAQNNREVSADEEQCTKARAQGRR